jgi:two-component system, chemotaxis family, CheB/CheR fusion protein
MTSDESSSQPVSEPSADKIDPMHQDPVKAAFPIVGVAASAGGLEAFTQLLSHLPTDTGMAFVLIQHLSPDNESLLTEILARTTQKGGDHVDAKCVVLMLNDTCCRCTQSCREMPAVTVLV